MGTKSIMIIKQLRSAKEFTTYDETNKRQFLCICIFWNVKSVDLKFKNFGKFQLYEIGAVSLV